MLYFAVFYDVQTLVEIDHIACSCPAVYYLLGHLDIGVRALPLRSVDGVVACVPVEAVHAPSAWPPMILSAPPPPWT
jgi:hypothetical protein